MTNYWHSITRMELATITEALSHLPERCRYHGDNLEWGLRREPCCDTGRPSLARRKAEQTLETVKATELQPTFTDQVEERNDER